MHNVYLSKGLVLLTRTYFSLSPRHLLIKELEVMLKNVALHSVATAFASIVFPVKFELLLFYVRTHQNLHPRIDETLLPVPGGP